MFCDLVGSTSLAAKLDAEDWRNLVNAYLDQASAAVTELGGHVLKKLGDGLMALFGYPQAQENDAERAVRAALAILRALVEINTRNASKGAPELSARIGLDSGSVVVDAAGEVFGEAPNVAARVQAAAEPGTVLITASVQRQTAGLFVVEDKGAHDLKGVTAPVELYRVVRASGGGRRGGARALTPLVGREDELTLLTRRWSRALEGDGQFVQIVGEPGIGKSRLIEEFRAKLAETPHTWVEWAASQLLQNTPLHPLAEWGRLRFGGADTTDEGRLADLENTLRLVGLDPDEYAPLIAPLVDIPLPEERSAKLAPEELRRRQLAAVTAWYFAGARAQTAVLVFEDLHWADPTSLDLLRSLAERGAQAPLLIVATTRPEFRPPWAMRSHHGVISLAPLDRAEVRRMVGEIASRHALSEEVIDRVGERTGGVPLFVEEVTRLLLERDVEGGAQAIPPTLQQSLAARLDRLGEAREVAQVGAVLGRDFSYRLLSDVSSAAAGFDELRLQAALDRLMEADLLFVDGAPPAAAYRFKHALIRDAAYESLLKSRRQALHHRAADALVAADAEPEAIAHHFTEAGLDDLAIEWWGKAGDQALRRSAFQEAIAHLGKGIEMADRAGATARQASGGSAAPSKRLTQMQVAYGNALFAARGVGATETTEAFAKARESAYGDKDAPERLAADWGLWAGSYVRGELPSMRAHAAAFLSDIEARPDSPEAGVAHRTAGITSWFAGEYREARDHLERALALFQPGRDDDLTFRLGLDPGIATMVNLANASWPLGEVDRAISLIERAQCRSAEFTHAVVLAFARMHSALFDLMRRDHARAAPRAFELAQLAREHELTMYGTFGAFLEGWASAAGDAPGGGLADMRRAVDELREQNVLLFDGLLKIALAEAEARAGDPDRAIAILDEALATADRIGYRAFEAELHRARGDTLLKRDPANPASAEEAFLTAIAVAKQQATHSFELRAALPLARLYQSTGRPTEAHAVLAPALHGFAPTPEMPEIAEAQALLAVLEEMDEVKSEVARRRRKTWLHAAYGNAMILAHGYGARETSAAFERARDTATAEDGFERLSAQYGLWAGSFVRSELGAMRELSAAMLRDCERRPQSGEASIAHRMRGVTHWFAGEFAASRGHLEQATAIFDPERDGNLAFRFGQDPGVVATAYLAEVLWLLGEVGLADQRMTETTARAAKSGHAATSAYGFFMATRFELIRRNPDRAATFARSLIKIANEHQLPFWMANSAWFDGWLEWRSGDREPGLAAMRNSLARQAEQSIGAATTFFETLLAEAEAEAGESDVAFCTINHALAASERTGRHWYDVETHRIRGEILLRRNSADTLTAEEAFQRAIAVAGEQGARSFQLRAALSLAKLYQSTERPAEAHAVLEPALQGFSSTPEMPEIAEARALLVAIEAAAHARHE
jgi:class 3 adenylate cyclase/predicted ATPase